MPKINTTRCRTYASTAFVIKEYGEWISELEDQIVLAPVGTVFTFERSAPSGKVETYVVSKSYIEVRQYTDSFHGTTSERMIAWNELEKGDKVKSA